MILQPKQIAKPRWRTLFLKVGFGASVGRYSHGSSAMITYNELKVFHATTELQHRFGSAFGQYQPIEKAFLVGLA